MKRLRSIALAGLITSGSPLLAQNPEVGPVNVYDLSRALRDSGQADLAIEYLDSLTTKLPKEQQPELKLERAKARLEQANQEAVDAKRDDLIAVSKKEFEEFLKAYPTHPRVAEANISLARVTTLLGKQQLGRAGKAEAEKPEDTAKLRKEQMALARPFFEQSAKQYAAAAKKLEDQANAALATSTKRELITGLYQALLDQGINQYYLGDSYGKTSVKAEVTERYNAYKAARELFAALSKRDEKHPLCWVAKAWEGECNRPMQELGKADKVNDEIRAAWVKEPQGAPAAGYRMARFFAIRDKWLEADGKGATPAAFQLVRRLADEWMKDYKSAKLTPEHYAVMYYVATSNLDEAKLAIKYDEKTKTTTIPDTSRVLLTRAERDFRILTQTDNDYENRARKERMTIIRLLVGEGTKNPATILTFDEAHMTMQVVYAKLSTFLKDNPPPDENTPEKDAKEYKQKKDELFNRVIALLNREKELPVPRESAKDAADSQILMIYLYRQAGRTYEAAVMAEALARSARTSSTIAKAGENAVYAYLEAFQKNEDEESKAVDLARALNVAAYLDVAAPEEPATEEIRLTQAKLLVQSKRYMDAFDVLGKIKLGSNSLVEARLLQGGIAYELLRAKSPMEAPAAKKNAIRSKAIADLARVSTPSKPTDSLRYVKLKLQLAQLYLTGPATGYPAAEKVVVDTIAQIPTLNGLKDEDKLALQMQAEMVHIDTVYGQAMPLFNAGQYKECSDRFVPMLVSIAKAGPANKDTVPGDLKISAGRLDAMRLDRLIMPSLSARARQGEIDSCTELLDLARLFGGDLSKSASAVLEVIKQAKFQVEKLRAENKGPEAEAMMGKVGGLLNKLLEEKNITPGMKYGIAKGCRELGQYPKAIELLSQIPKPKNIDPKQPPRSTGNEPEEEQIKINAALAAYEEEMKLVNLYKASQLELARVYREAKMIPQGDALYDEMMGKADVDKAKHRRTGWASNLLEFRKEFYNYSEVKASTITDEKAAQAQWVEAIGNWSNLVGEYAKVINSRRQQLIAKPAEGMAPLTPEQRQTIEDQMNRLLNIYFDMQFETFRCTVAANISLYAKKPDVLAKSMLTQGKKIAEVETKNPKIPNDVRARYRGLLNEHKALEPPYKAAGGLGFPDLAPEEPKPATAATAAPAEPK
jgi:hypothetical protein